MVNVNKNIVPGKKAESSDKTTSQAPARRPRNTALNSSKKLPDSIKSRRKQKLNCSREQVIDQLVNEEQIYTQEEAEELVSSFEEQTGATVDRLATVEEVEEQDGEFWATKDGRTTLWCRGNGMWYDSGISDEGAALNSSKKSEHTKRRSLNSSLSTGLEGLIEAVKASDAQDYYDKFKVMQTNPAYEEELMADAYYKAEQMLSEKLGVPNVMLETSVQQGRGSVDAYADGGTGEHLASYDFEDESEAIWDIIKNWNGDANGLVDAVAEKVVDFVSMSAGLDSSRSQSMNCSADDETNLDDIKITTESGNEVSMQDIKIVQNPDTNELAIFIPEDEEETIPEGFTVIGMVVPDALDSAPAIEGGDVCPECGQDPCVCEGPEEEGEELDSSRKKNELTEDSVDSSLGGGDDRQDATSQVTVPKSFPDDKVHDLYRWVESELQHEGIDVDVYGVGRPSASTISFEFEVTGRDPAEVDAIIEDRVKEFIANGNNAIKYPEGDPRSELNSEKQEKNLNCTVENARVEPTEQGTWVVKADTDRFGKDAILYEHYSEEGANKYLDRLKAGGDAVANGYDGSTDDINIRYKGYFITGNDKIRYVCVSPYGKYSPKSYATLDEAKAAVDEDIKTSKASK